MNIIVKALLSLPLALALISCGTTAGLPRDTEEVRSEYKAAGDSVFSDVWGQACNELHSLMVVKDGKVVYERWSDGHTPGELHIMWSASKTFTATAIGFAVQDGILNLDDKIVKFFNESELPAIHTKWLDSLSIYDLLIMSSGLHDDFIGRANSGEIFDWAEETLKSGMDFEPGSRFRYNSMNTYLLSVIVSRVTGEKMADYLDRKLFKPLGIDKYIWQESPQGYNCGGWGLFITTESLAKMGQFMLHKGEWKGKRLLYEKWFDKAMKTQILQYKGLDPTPGQLEQFKTDNWNQGYCYQMWTCCNGAVRIDGAWGQYAIIFPDKNLVVVATSHSSDGSAIVSSIERHFGN